MSKVEGRTPDWLRCGNGIDVDCRALLKAFSFKHGMVGTVLGFGAEMSGPVESFKTLYGFYNVRLLMFGVGPSTK